MLKSDSRGKDIHWFCKICNSEHHHKFKSCRRIVSRGPDLEVNHCEGDLEPRIRKGLKWVPLKRKPKKIIKSVRRRKT